MTKLKGKIVSGCSLKDSKYKIKYDIKRDDFSYSEGTIPFFTNESFGNQFPIPILFKEFKGPKGLEAVEVEKK